MIGQAAFSPCRRWRYSLERSWSGEGTVLFVGLNPATADEHRLDPTCVRCMNYAKRWGFGTYLMGNLYAWRDGTPKNLDRRPLVPRRDYDPRMDLLAPEEEDLFSLEPVGAENDEWLDYMAFRADLIICAWGSSKWARARQDDALKILTQGPGPRSLKVKALNLTKDGYPCHPLYQRADLRPVNFPRGSIRFA